MSLEALTSYLKTLQTAVTHETCKSVIGECKEILFSAAKSQKKELCMQAMEKCGEFWAELYGPVVAPMVIATLILGAAVGCCCTSIGCCALGCIGNCLGMGENRPKYKPA